MARSSRPSTRRRTFHLVPDLVLASAGVIFLAEAPPGSSNSIVGAATAQAAVKDKLWTAATAARGNVTNPDVYVPAAIGVGLKIVSSRFSLGRRTHIVDGLSLF